MEITIVVLYESGHRKSFNELTSFPKQTAECTFGFLAMPSLMIASAIILILTSFMSFIFTCQTNYSIQHDAGNDFFQRLTRMTVRNTVMVPNKKKIQK
jgi:hypothetical protein